MKALISPNEPAGNGVRVAQVSEDDKIFEVGLPLYWNDCPNDCVADMYYYNPTTHEYHVIIPSASENKQMAMYLLQQTDWTSIADVGNPQMSNPYLANQAAFIAWRSQIRAIAVNPVEGNIDFPEMPSEVWQSV